MPLSETQKEALKQFMLAFANYDKAVQLENQEQIIKNKKIIEKLSSVSLDTLLKFVKANKDFEKKCETHEVIKQKWESILREKNHPTLIRSVDAKQSYSAFKLLLGTKYFTLYKKQAEQKNESSIPNPELLDRACDFGIFESLNSRLAIYLSLFGALLDKGSNTTSVLKQIQKDCKRIGNLYWTPGYLKAYENLSAVAEKFYKTVGGYNEITKKIYSAALECLLYAQFLQDHPASKALIKIIYGGHGIIKGNHNKFNKWEQAIKELSDKGQFSQKEIEVVKKEVLQELADFGILYTHLDQEKKLGS